MKINIESFQCINVIILIMPKLLLSRFIYEISQGGNMGNAWDTAKDGIMSEEDYPYEHKVLANHTSP